MGVQLQRLEVRGPDDFDRVFQAATKERAGALITLDDAFVFTQRTRIVKLAAKSRLPAIYLFQGVCGRLGGLCPTRRTLPTCIVAPRPMSTRSSREAKPADLPVEQPTKFEFIVNLKAAKQIGLTIPPNVLARADKVIK